MKNRILAIIIGVTLTLGISATANASGYGSGVWIEGGLIGYWCFGGIGTGCCESLRFESKPNCTFNDVVEAALKADGYINTTVEGMVFSAQIIDSTTTTLENADNASNTMTLPFSALQDWVDDGCPDRE